MFKLFHCLFMCALIFKNTLALNDEQKTNIRKTLAEFGEECIVQYPLSTDDIESFKNQTFPESENAGCIVACVFNKSGIFNENGEVSQTTVIEKAKTLFNDEDELKNLENLISVCATKVNDNDVTDNMCDRAKLVYSCLIKNSDQFGFSIDF